MSFQARLDIIIIKKSGPEEGVYIRAGTTNRKADTEMIKELNRIVSNQTFDEQPLTALNSEAIDFRAALEQFEKIRKIDKKDLETVVILMDYQGKKYLQFRVNIIW